MPKSLALVFILLAAGCASHIDGAAYEGLSPGVAAVSNSDARFNQSGLPEVTIQATLDPDSMDPTQLGTVVTDDKGRFSIAVPHAGAGLMEYELQLICRRPGFQPTVKRLPLPGSRQKLLVNMAPGRDFAPPQDSFDVTMPP